MNQLLGQLSVIVTYKEINKHTSGLDVKLTTHLHLMQRLRISGAVLHSPTLLHGVHRVDFTSAL
jgi:hypothetical protein